MTAPLLQRRGGITDIFCFLFLDPFAVGLKRYFLTDFDADSLISNLAIPIVIKKYEADNNFLYAMNFDLTPITIFTEMLIYHEKLNSSGKIMVK